MTEIIGDTVVSFALAPMASGAAVGVTRSVSASNAGTFEQVVVFTSQDDFERWVDEDEFRNVAPGLMRSLRIAFDGLFKPGTQRAAP